MRWSVVALIALLSPFPAISTALAEGNQDYSVLIISRERLEVGTPCEIGIYMQDQLVARLFQEQSTSFNLPAGKVSIRLNTLPGQAPGCQAGMGTPNATMVTLRAGEITKYRVANGLNGLYLKPADLNY